MDRLIEQIEHLKHSSSAKIIEKRLISFKNNGKQSEDHLFSELCYCILTANCSAESCLKIQQDIHLSFYQHSTDSLSKKLRSHHYRFPNTRAHYIISAKEYKQMIGSILTHYGHLQRREWLVKYIKGLGYKEASHFLRNTGFFDYAILDRHILSILASHKKIKIPKTLTKKTYLSIENTMKTIAKQTQLSLGSLDLYLWYMSTGKILK